MTSKSRPTFGALALVAALGVAGAGFTSGANAAVLPSLGAAAPATAVGAEAHAELEVQKVQYRGPNRGYGPGPRAFGPGPRAYGPGPRYYAPGPRYYAPGPRAYGPAPRAWGYRPWYHRPYYGTIIGGLALGTIVGVAAYGLAPQAPRPDLCWYWADELQSRGYWDYC